MSKSWKERVVEAFEELGKDGARVHLSQVYEYIAQRYPNLSKTYQATIRATIERNSKDSAVYEGKGDVFASCEGKGKGLWKLSEEYRSEMKK